MHWGMNGFSGGKRAVEWGQGGCLSGDLPLAGHHGPFQGQAESLALSIQWTGQVIWKPAGLLSLGDPQRADFLFLVEHVIESSMQGQQVLLRPSFPQPSLPPSHRGLQALSASSEHLSAVSTVTYPPTGSPGPQGVARCQVRTFKTNMKLQASS